MKTYESVLPIFQDFHTGLYGFIQNNNMYNLKEAIYKTKRAAVIARNKYCKQTDEMQTYHDEMIPCPRCKTPDRREEIEKIGTCYKRMKMRMYYDNRPTQTNPS